MKIMERKAYMSFSETGFGKTVFGETGFGETGRHQYLIYTTLLLKIRNSIISFFSITWV